MARITGATKQMWQVVLTAPIPISQNDYPSDYFPRKFRYKTDAIKLKQVVEAKCGSAKIEKVK